MTKTSDIDALFKGPLVEFTKARNALASRLKKEGRSAEAEQVKAMAKPTATAWAVNQLFWQEPKAFERLFKIGEKVRKEQTGGGAGLRGALEERRRVVSELTGRAAEILRDGGHADSPEARRRMAITFESLASHGRSNVAAEIGRLTSDLEPLGFDGVAALLDGKKLEPGKILQFRRATEGKRKADDAAAVRARAHEALKAAEKALTAARREAERAEEAVAKAAARAQKLEEERREIEARCQAAREEVRAASGVAKKAAQSVAEAERAVTRARGEVEDA